MARAGNNKTIYRFAHAEIDGISDTSKKISFVNDLLKKGFDVEMKIFSKEDVDGRYIKNMNHGMGLSMKLFFSEAFNQIQTKVKDDRRIDFDFKHTLNFVCEKKTYVISYKGNSQPKCTLLNLAD